MINFKNYWQLVNEAIKGYWPVLIYKSEKQLISPLTRDFIPEGSPLMAKVYLNTNHQNLGLDKTGKHRKVSEQAAMYAELTDRTNDLTTMLHLCRGKIDSKLSEILTQACISALVKLVKDTVAESKVAVKVVYPESEEGFNQEVATKLAPFIPNVPLIMLPKKMLKELSPQLMFPSALKKGSKAESDRSFYLLLLYNDYVKTDPKNARKQPSLFSRSDLAKNLKRHHIAVGDKINQFVNLSPAAMKDLAGKNGSDRISDAIIKTPAIVFHSREEILPGDHVIFFDDNISGGFTTKQIQKAMPGTTVNSKIYGLKVL